MIEGKRRGKYRNTEHSAQLMAHYEDEEDITITGSNKDLTTGTLSSGNLKENLVAMGIHNYGDSAALVKYKLYGSTTTRSVYLQPGSTFSGMPRITTIVVSGSTASATVKVLYWDAANYSGIGPIQYNQD